MDLEVLTSWTVIASDPLDCVNTHGTLGPTYSSFVNSRVTSRIELESVQGKQISKNSEDR